jgi:hypothetical protein
MQHRPLVAEETADIFHLAIKNPVVIAVVPEPV